MFKISLDNIPIYVIIILGSNSKQNLISKVKYKQNYKIIERSDTNEP